jgi:fumarate reductase subunit D
MDRYARRAGAFPVKRIALVHRLSGIALAVFLPVHFWALGLGLQMDAFLRWTEQPLVKLSEWGIVVLLAAHIGGGLRVLAIEFLDWHEWQKSLAAIAGAILLAAGLAFALAL